jgi:outer membrane protein assembly factor BamB
MSISKRLFGMAEFATVLAFANWSAQAAPSIVVTPSSNHPSASVAVTGTGFGANEGIDIYFDTADEMLVVSDSSGAFAKHAFNVPSGALPGQHWVTAIGHRDGDAAQNAFKVSTSWAEYGFNARNRRNNPYGNVISANSVSALDTLWVSLTGGSVESSPAIANGIVYVGSGDDKLYAFTAAAGALKWSAATGGNVLSSPAVASGVVYAGSDDGKLYAFNATNGAPKWSAMTSSFVESSPAVVNGVVYAASGDFKLYAFDAGTGARKWSTAAGGSINASPVVANGTAYVGAEDGRLYAFDATTGTLKWSAATTSSIFAAAAVSNGIVYVGSEDNKLYAVDAGTGGAIWTFTTGGATTSCPGGQRYGLYRVAR